MYQQIASRHPYVWIPRVFPTLSRREGWADYTETTPVANEHAATQDSNLSVVPDRPPVVGTSQHGDQLRLAGHLARLGGGDVEAEDAAQLEGRRR